MKKHQHIDKYYNYLVNTAWVKERMPNRKLSTAVNIPPTVRRAMRKIYLSQAPMKIRAIMQAMPTALKVLLV